MGCHFLLQGNLPDPGIEPRSPTLQANALTSEPSEQRKGRKDRVRKDLERKGVILEGFSLLGAQSCLFYRQHRCYYLIYARLIESAFLLPLLSYILEPSEAMQFGIKLFLMFIFSVSFLKTSSLCLPNLCFYYVWKILTDGTIKPNVIQSIIVLLFT